MNLHKNLINQKNKKPPLNKLTIVLIVFFIARVISHLIVIGKLNLMESFFYSTGYTCREQGR